jgi:VanZ family protein
VNILKQNLSIATPAVLSLILLVGFHALALKLYLYWSLWWFDIVMHFLGGLTVSLFLHLLYTRRKSKDKASFTTIILLSLAAAFLVGLFWEVVEFKSDLTFTTGITYGEDTLLDVIMDLVGAFVGGVYVYFVVLRERILETITENEDE